MLYNELLPYITERLTAAGIPSEDAEAEARIIAEDIGELPLTALMANPEFEVNNGKLGSMNKVINIRTLERKPLQYLVPEWEWYGTRLKLSSDVLCPRQETEMLIDIVRSFCKGSQNDSPIIADLCSGSGNIAVTLKGMFPNGKIFAVENSPLAVSVLKNNCQMNNADVEVVLGSVLEASTVQKLRFSGEDPVRADIIVCNPPYLTKMEMNTLQPELKHEPEAALYGGLDGLDFYRVIPTLWEEALVPGGLLLFEIGAEQARDVRRILSKAGYERITVRQDLMGNDRVVMAYSPE